MTEREYRLLLRSIRETIANSTPSSTEALYTARRLAAALSTTCQWEMWKKEKKERAVYETEEREKMRVANALSRTRKVQLPSTLTFEQWIATVEHYHWRCAYCRERSYQVLEHFVPVELGGGTTASNCVPACRPCNFIKGRLHPDLIDTLFAHERISQVRTYLQQFS